MLPLSRLFTDGRVTSMSTSDAVNWSAAGAIAAIAAVFVTVLTLVSLRGARLSKIETDIYYLRRDMDQLLKLYKLVPAEEQDKRPRR